MSSKLIHLPVIFHAVATLGETVCSKFKVRQISANLRLPIWILYEYYEFFQKFGTCHPFSYLFLGSPSEHLPWCLRGEGSEGRGKHSDLHCRSYQANGPFVDLGGMAPSNASGCKKQDCGLLGFIWIYMGLYGFIWIYMDLYGFIWVYMDLYTTSERKQNKTCNNLYYPKDQVQHRIFNKWHSES